jgi:hypothetical protein
MHNANENRRRQAELYRQCDSPMKSAKHLISRIAELRQIADRCRQAARVPTKGGHRTDRVLLRVADKLEREATALEATADDTARG